MELKRNRKIVLLPLIGMVLFLLLYTIAALHYPGGSYSSPDQAGFDIKDNYLCDLLDQRAINGTLNSARNYARAALGVLCLGLMVLWYYMPRLFSVKRKRHLVMSVAGIASMVTTLLLGLGAHDIIVRIAGVFGFIALLILLTELYKDSYYGLLALGVVGLIIFLTNYYMYELDVMIDSLAVVQKFTFLIFLIWFALLNIGVYKKLKLNKH